MPAWPATPSGMGGNSGNFTSSTRLPVFVSQVACFASNPPETTLSANGASQYTPAAPPLCPSKTAPAAPVFGSNVRIVPVAPPERIIVFPSVEYSAAWGSWLAMIPVSVATVQRGLSAGAAGSPPAGGTTGGSGSIGGTTTIGAP